MQMPGSLPRHPRDVARLLSHGWTRTFGLLVGAQTAHAAGNAVVAVALANTLFFAVPLGEARWRVALYLLITMLPFAFLAPVLGRLVDARRVGARWVLVGAGGLRVVVAWLLVARIDGWELFPLALAFLVLSRAHGVTRVAVVPDALPPGRSLVWANTWMAVVSSGGAAIGAAVAVLVVRISGSGGAMALAAVLFAVVTVLCFGLPDRRHGGPVPSPHTVAPVVVPPRVLAAGSAVTVLRCIVGFVTFYLAFVLKADYSSLALGAVFVAAGIGGAAGSFVSIALARWLPTWTVPTALLGLVAVATAFAFVGFGLDTAIVLAATVGLASAGSRLAFDSELQSSVDRAGRGRMLMRYETVFQVTWVVGALLSLPPIGATAGRVLLVLVVAASCVVAGRHFVAAHGHSDQA